MTSLLFFLEIILMFFEIIQHTAKKRMVAVVEWICFARKIFCRVAGQCVEIGMVVVIVCHRTHDGKTIGQLRQLWQTLTDGNTGNRGRGRAPLAANTERSMGLGVQFFKFLGVYLDVHYLNTFGLAI